MLIPNSAVAELYALKKLAQGNQRVAVRRHDGVNGLILEARKSVWERIATWVNMVL